MSKLLDKIEQAHQEPARRMGFGPAPQQQSNPLPLLIGVVEAGQALPPQETRKHLDALVFKTHDHAGVEALGSGPGVPPWGLWAERATADTLHALREKGGDFLLFSPEPTPLQLLQDEGVGKVLLVPPEWDQQLALALQQLPVDAIALALHSPAPLTVKHLLSVSGLRRLAGKPLLLFLAQPPAQQELQVLRDSGVDGICLNVLPLTTEAVAQVRQHIATLPRRQRRPERRLPPALVPRVPSAAPPKVEEEEEEDF